MGQALFVATIIAVGHDEVCRADGSQKPIELMIVLADFILAR
jgi:hypothetical protein